MHFTGRLKPIKVHDKQACSAEVCRVLSIAAECCSREHAPSPRSPIDAASLSPWRGRDGFRSLVHSTASALAQAFYENRTLVFGAMERGIKKGILRVQKVAKVSIVHVPEALRSIWPRGGRGWVGERKKKGERKTSMCMRLCVLVCVTLVK